MVYLLALVAAAFVPAADAAPPEASPPAVEASPTSAAIPGAQVAEGLDTVRGRLRDLDALLGHDPRAAAISAGLPDTLQALADLSRHSWSTITSQSPPVYLIDVEDRWKDWQQQLQTRQSILTDLVAQLERVIGEFVALQTRWEGT